MKKIALILFALATAGVLISSLVSIKILYMISKPMIMPALLFYYLFSSEHAERSRPLFLAIVFSFVGDVLLMNDSYFISGLVAFLLAHVMYIFAYRQYRSEPTEGSLQGLQRLRLAFPVILGGTGLIVILYPVLSDLRIPVIIYAFVLMLMVITAIFRMGRTNQKSFWTVLLGAILFMISDSLLAINKFLDPFAYAGFWIMVFYCAAQYFIVRGLMNHQSAGQLAG
jgi:uncharacterized membrane protein YhhN